MTKKKKKSGYWEDLVLEERMLCSCKEFLKDVPRCSFALDMASLTR